jgi:hypothetical protein
MGLVEANGAQTSCSAGRSCLRGAGGSKMWTEPLSAQQGIMAVDIGCSGPPRPGLSEFCSVSSWVDFSPSKNAQAAGEGNLEMDSPPELTMKSLKPQRRKLMGLRVG